MLLQLGALAALIVPLFLWLRWRHSLATVYQGNALVSDKFRGAGPSGEWAVVLDVPGHGNHIVYVDKKRADRLDLFSRATVTLNKRLLSKPFVDAFSLQDDVPRTAGEKFNGLYMAGFYLMLGLGAAIASIQLVGTMSQFWLAFMALSLVAAGFVFNLYRFSKEEAAKTGDAKFLRLPLGKGRRSLFAMAAITLAATVACFWSFTFFILFPGLHMAFGFGAVMGILLRGRSA